MKALLLTALLPGLALAAPPPSTRKVAALIVPMDKDAEAYILKAEGFVNESLKEYPGFIVRTSDELFGVPADEDAAASLKRAELGFNESRLSFDERKYDEAERKLRATIKEFGKAVAAMNGCGHLCDAVAMYATTLQARGDVEEAKIAILDLLALGPSFELDRKRYPQDFLALKAQVATSRNAQLRGNIVVKTRPAGARVYLNGEFQGFTPHTIQTAPIGKALLRIERPGFRQVGVLVEVTPEDQNVTQELVSTSAYKAYDGLLDKLAGEALKDKGGATMSAVSKSLALDHAVIGVLKNLETGSQSELTLAYFDLRNGRRLGVKRATFQGDEYGQLKGEVGRMVNHLVNNAESGGEKVSRSGDPLDNRAGTEDWNAEDRGGRTNSRDKKKKTGNDPLDGVSGTEDW